MHTPPRLSSGAIDAALHRVALVLVCLLAGCATSQTNGPGSTTVPRVIERDLGGGTAPASERSGPRVSR